MSKETNKTKAFPIRIDEKIHMKLKIRAAQEGKSMQHIIEKLIVDYINETCLLY